MNIQDVFNGALHVIPNLSRHKDVVIGIKRVIKTINSRHRGLRDTKKIITAIDVFTGTFTFAAAGNTINDDDIGDFVDDFELTVGDKIWFSGEGALNVTELTIASIQNDAGTNDQITVSETIVNDAAISGTFAGFTLLNGYSYNHLTGVIGFPNTVKEIVEIFKDGEELKVVDYDDLNNGTYLKTYASLGRRKFVISSDIYGTDIEILAWFDLENLSVTTQATVIDVPEDYEDIIQDGVIYYLTSMPLYKDEFLNGKTETSFFSAIQILRDEQAVAFPTPRRETRKFY